MEITENIDLIEYRGFKKFFIGLYKEKKDYYVVYGFTDDPVIEASSYNDNSPIDHSPKMFINISRELWIRIPFIPKDGVMCHAIHINDKEEYYHIINILETLL